MTKLVKDGAAESLKAHNKADSSVIVTKDAKEAYSQLGGMFVLYLASTATDISKEQKRSKVSAEDVFKALKELGFENYEEQLRDYLKNYNAEKEDVPRKGQMSKRQAPADDRAMDDCGTESKREKLD